MTVRRIAALAAILVVLGAAGPARAFLAGSDLVCRQGLAKQTRRYLEHVHRVRQRCLRKIYSGKISPLTDCVGETGEGTGDERTTHRIDAARAAISAALPKKCLGANLETLGFPGACPTEPGVPFDITDLETCMVNTMDEVIANMLIVESPPSDFLPPNTLTCVSGVGRHAAAMVRKEVRARERCLLAQDQASPFTEELTCRDELPPYGVGTGSEEIDQKILEGYIDLLAGVPTICKLTNVDRLGWTDDCEDTSGGRFSTFDLKICIFDNHRSSAAEIVECAFPAPAECGNGKVEGEEACDDGNTNQDDGCLNNCTAARCGDGVVRTGVEECDDGNAIATDACLNNCKAARCGDAIVCSAASCTSGPAGGVEQCDDANTNQSDPCLNNCKRAECGDGQLCTTLTPVKCTSGPESGPEVCDDGNKTAGDGCNTTCDQEFCGDSVTQTGLGEQCDNGPQNSNTQPDACRGNCKLPRCGDSVIDTGEGCDPPNGTSCSSTCTALLCGNGRLDSGEECDNGAANSNTTPDACRTNCTRARCGDGIKDPSNSEACDDGNTSNEDACVAGCKANVCGDGFRNPATEQCDDHNTVNTDACANCKNAACGDGFVRAGVEDCDDANTVDTDRCRANCKNATCGDAVKCSAASCTSGPASGPEECDAGTANSNTTPNACRTNCSLAGCGDGVVDSGEQCDGAAGTCTGGGTCADSCTCANECPGSGELTVLAKDGRTCTGDGDCLAGNCIEGRCRTGSRLDTGMSGLAHGGDITDGVVARGFLRCGGTFPCGVCEVTGLDASTGTCRCENDNRKICDQPFVADSNDCGGGICNCYFGPPLAFSSGNTPACVVNRFAEDVSGTANVDLGQGEITTKLRSIVFLGEVLSQPCPYCRGDDLENDLVRNGTCVLGPNDGQPCDSNGFNTSFPGPNGGGHSLDCFPSTGKNVSGTGLRIELTQRTGHSELAISGDVICGFPPIIKIPCWCLQCSGDGSVSCTSNADCAAAGLGTCTSTGGADRPTAINSCDGNPGKCVPVDDTGVLGECEQGPDDTFCDGYVRASGEGYIQCQTNGDCSEGNIGIPAGVCRLVKRRACFLDPIIADGQPDPSNPVGAATFCIPPTSNPGINQVAGIPGPGRVFTQAHSRLFCANDPSKIYTPGVGGCE